MTPRLDPRQTVPVMTERRFVVLRCEGKVPAMALCTNCQRKFFTPAAFAVDAVGAECYLIHKFDLHRCSEDREQSGGRQALDPAQVEG